MIANFIEETALLQSADTPVRLPHLGVLRFRGPDAAAFLQGQVSNDTAP